MDLMERRALLHAIPNPNRSLDYLVTLSGHLPSGGGVRQRVEVRYVPDREIFASRSFGTYLDVLSNMVWETPEDLAVTVLTDLDNQIVCRWIQVHVNVPELQHHAVDTHGVIIENRQPGWDNPALMRRLERI